MPNIASAGPCRNWPKPPPAPICRTCSIPTWPKPTGTRPGWRKYFQIVRRHGQSQEMPCHRIGLIDEAERIAKRKTKMKRRSTPRSFLPCKKLNITKSPLTAPCGNGPSLLGQQEAAAILQGILNEERAADQKLSEIARSHVNEEGLTSQGGGSNPGGMVPPRPRSTRPVRVSRAAEFSLSFRKAFSLSAPSDERNAASGQSPD